MAYHRMNDQERDRFLRDPVRPAVVATRRADGRPHAAPVWYELDGDTIVFTTGADTVKGRNLARDPRVALCVQDDRPPFSFTTVEGTAELVHDRDQVHRWATRIGGRYMGTERAAEYGQRNAVPGELVVRVHVLHSVSVRDVAD